MSFPEGSVPDVEVCVRMLKNNSERNKGLFSACRPLSEYSWLIAKIREKQAFSSSQEDSEGLVTTRTEAAINQALREMPDDFVIKPFLMANQAEVKGMLLTEYDEEAVHQLFFEDGREEGLIEGCERTHIEMIRNLMSSLQVSGQIAMNMLKIPAEEQDKYLQIIDGPSGGGEGNAVD